MNRRRLLAVSIGAVGAAAAVGAVGISQAATSGPGAPSTGSADSPAATGDTPADGEPIEPAGGAGLFDVDPDQGDVSQDPNVSVVGDTTVMPEDMEF